MRLWLIALLLVLCVVPDAGRNAHEVLYVRAL